MNKKFFVLGICILAFFLLGNNTCELISFGGGDYPIDITIKETFTVNSQNATFADEATVYLSDIFGDEGVPEDLIEEVHLAYAIVEVLSSNLAPGTLVDGTISFRALGSGWIEIASFDDLDLSALLQAGTIISPIDDVLPLMDMNEIGVNALNQDISANPPPDIEFRFSGTSSSTPVQFSVDMIIVIQVVVTSE